MNKRGGVTPYKLFYYIIFVFVFAFLLSYSAYFVNKNVKSSSDEYNVEDSVSELKNSIIIHKVINECFVYDSNGRVEMGVVDKKKINNDILKKCLSNGASVYVNIGDLSATNIQGDIKDMNDYREAVLLDDGSTRVNAIIKVSVQNVQ